MWYFLLRKFKVIYHNFTDMMNEKIAEAEKNHWNRWLHLKSSSLIYIYIHIHIYIYIYIYIYTYIYTILSPTHYWVVATLCFMLSSIHQATGRNHLFLARLAGFSPCLHLLIISVFLFSKFGPLRLSIPTFHPGINCIDLKLSCRDILYYV